MVTNAFILYRANLLEDEQSTIILKKFQEKLVTQLCEVRKKLETHLTAPAQMEKEHHNSCNISHGKSATNVTQVFASNLTEIAFKCDTLVYAIINLRR